VKVGGGGGVGKNTRDRNIETTTFSNSTERKCSSSIYFSWFYTSLSVNPHRNISFDSAEEFRRKKLEY